MVRVVDVSEQVRNTVPVVESDEVRARKRRARNRGSHAGLRHGDGWRRSPQDQQLLEWCTRLGAINVRQAQRYIYKGAFSTASKRVASMAQAGLLQRIDTMPWAGTVVWPTQAGRVAAVGKESPLAAMEPPSDSTMLHRLLVAEEALRLLDAGREVITEREARLHETTVDGLGERELFLEQRGVRRSIDGSRGVVPSEVTIEGVKQERWMTMPMVKGRTDFRIPDLLEVTDRGELRAIEVEITPKATSRFRAILESYREACMQHGPAPKDAGWDLGKAGPKLGQFVGVRWVVADAVGTQLIGHPGGINPISGKDDPGMIRSLWDASPTTHLFYKDENTWSMRREGWPCSVTPLDLSHDRGLEFALCQQTLPAAYRTSLRNWTRWRRLWESDVADDENPVGFAQWVRFPGNLARCKQIANG